VLSQPVFGFPQEPSNTIRIPSKRPIAWFMAD
jgi:hypothetical protein